MARRRDTSHNLRSLGVRLVAATLRSDRRWRFLELAAEGSPIDIGRTIRIANAPQLPVGFGQMNHWTQRYAMDKWLTWFGRRPKRIGMAIISARRHQNRKATLMLSDESRAPQVVVKLGWDAVSCEGIAQEYRILQAAHSQIPAQFSAKIPIPLDCVDLAGDTAMFTTAVGGRLSFLPEILGPRSRSSSTLVRRYIDRVTQWSAGLSESTRKPTSKSRNLIDEYKRRFPGHGSIALRLPKWPDECAWQHGDPAIGNVLFTRSGLKVIDWEFASPNKLPWHDAAYLLLFMATVAARQERIGPIHAFEALYQEPSWCGDLVLGSINDSWPHSIEIGPALAVTALELALELHDPYSIWSQFVPYLLSNRSPKWLRD